MISSDTDYDLLGSIETWKYLRPYLEALETILPTTNYFLYIFWCGPIMSQ